MLFRRVRQLRIGICLLPVAGQALRYGPDCGGSGREHRRADVSITPVGTGNPETSQPHTGPRMNTFAAINPRTATVIAAAASSHVINRPICRAKVVRRRSAWGVAATGIAAYAPEGRVWRLAGLVVRRKRIRCSAALARLTTMVRATTASQAVPGAHHGIGAIEVDVSISASASMTAISASVGTQAVRSGIGPVPPGFCKFQGETTAA